MSITLPIPPSLNNAFANVKGRGRVKSAGYSAWVTEAGWMLKQAKPEAVKGKFSAAIYLPVAMRGDVDNRVKPLLDLLKTHRVIDDDKHCWSIFVSRSAEQKPGTCSVRVWEQI